jgi:hypothetical protein
MTVDQNGNYSGTSYVVFGKSDGTAVQLADIATDANSGGFALHGAAADDRSGWSVSGAGDVDDDGLDDVIIGAIGADPNGSTSGTSYVVYSPFGGETVWVDFAYNGISSGKFNQPYADLANAVAAVSPGGTIRIKGFTATTNTSEKLTMTKKMTINATGGTVRIGKQ